MSDQPKHRPNNCRNVLQARGEPYPRSGCAVCGNGGLAGCPYDQQGLAGALALAEVRIQQLEAKRDAAADYARDQATVLDLVAKALGVPDEPHQGRAERILEAAEGLSVYMERLREAVEFCNEHHHFGGWTEMLDEAPATSLARRRAEWQAELLEEYREELGSAGVAFVDCLAKQLRRQAEEPSE
ncbi:hypothetical protein SAMN04487957_11087 [Halomonas shengliensis]|uniref:Uncharacterized protein n=1 Tax=Halomonas shengliensis TaxID=419597 RepID=A0A1H0LSR4_9GAMM|nr:hypothetical protein [Halomonas shengliensis]SDO71081.1 hypothetical protein SAMN04487957_11087 [Halomonas shengliensis]